MKIIEQFFSELTDQELQQAFKEYESWRETGTLEDGIIRSTYNKFSAETGVKGTIHLVSEPLLYTIVKRHLNW
ncbi:hypothetical protein ABEV55_14740 [Aneurinibacillus thermoaerophilus]|uniref:hypothetical protein n=1 Tax=Aneurinibacillus thermoaerophilus TaxID=143495 RepID=UPI002E211EF6|nr:hypothetical protein [Aneurinibacillus thermoaerophilus]